MATIAEARKALAIKRKAREREKAFEAAAKAKEAEDAKPKKKKEKTSWLDSVRKAFSSDDDINRIDSALDAIERGVATADEVNEKKKKRKK